MQVTIMMTRWTNRSTKLLLNQLTFQLMFQLTFQPLLSLPSPRLSLRTSQPSQNMLHHPLLTVSNQIIVEPNSEMDIEPEI
jgi:hypothetical protein